MNPTRTPDDLIARRCTAMVEAREAAARARRAAETAVGATALSEKARRADAAWRAATELLTLVAHAVELVQSPTSRAHCLMAMRATERAVKAGATSKQSAETAALSRRTADALPRVGYWQNWGWDWRRSAALAAAMAADRASLEAQETLEQIGRAEQTVQALATVVLSPSPQGGVSFVVLRFAAFLLPRSRRSRWTEEWRGELATLSSSSKRGNFARQTLIGIPRLAVELRTSESLRARAGD